MDIRSAAINTVIVSVEYGDILAKTLPLHRHHFFDVMIVTTPDDHETISVAETCRCRTHQTRSFYAKGATFNKWLPLEEGLEKLGRDGWIAILDADIVWPWELPSFDIQPGNLYGPRRRMLRDVTAEIPDSSQWSQFPIYPSREFAGWTQLFHASDERLGPPPWHQIEWGHAGGADTFFQRKWPEDHQIRLPFEVLHLGEEGKNWCGRATRRVDGEIPVESATRSQKHLDFMLSRRRSNGYQSEKVPVTWEDRSLN